MHEDECRYHFFFHYLSIVLPIQIPMYSQRSEVAERPGQDKYDRFELWLRENGAQFDMVGANNCGLEICRFLAQYHALAHLCF